MTDEIEPPVVAKYNLTLANFDELMNMVVEQLKSHDTVIVAMRQRHMEGMVPTDVLRGVEEQRSIYESEYHGLLSWYAKRRGIGLLYNF